MRRDARLHGLSSDHHHALVLARRIHRTFEADDAGADFVEEVHGRYRNELRPHFDIEEELLLPALERAGQTELVRRTLRDHEALEALLKRARAGHPKALDEFASRLEAHVRFEERELFVTCERVLDSEVLDEVARRSPKPGGEQSTGIEDGRSPLPPGHRRARRDDAPMLAQLIDRAGEGLPRYLWSRAAEPGQSPFDVGIARAARTEGGFSYSNAVVREHDGGIAAMLLGYRLDETDGGGSDTADVPEVVVPLLALEAEAPGSWYVNAIAVAKGFEGRGMGRVLMGIAERLGRGEGASEMSLIVARENRRARELYERLGYTERAHQPVVPFPGCPHKGDWILMIKPL